MARRDASALADVMAVWRCPVHPRTEGLRRITLSGGHTCNCGGWHRSRQDSIRPTVHASLRRNDGLWLTPVNHLRVQQIAGGDQQVDALCDLGPGVLHRRGEDGLRACLAALLAGKGRFRPVTSRACPSAIRGRLAALALALDQLAWPQVAGGGQLHARFFAASALAMEPVRAKVESKDAAGRRPERR